jgi:hypothetical protein
MSLLISLRSELIKLKRTASVIVCFIAAAFPALMQFLEDIDIGNSRPMGAPWIEHFLKQREIINVAFLPMFIVLVSTLWLQIEYRDKTWKQVLTSPQKIINVFAAKFIVFHVLILSFLILYNIFISIGGVAAELMHPQLYNGQLDFKRLVIINAQRYFLTFGISAIQFWFALRFKNFIAPVAIGFVLWIVAPIMIFEMHWQGVEAYPYAYSILGVFPKYKANIVNYQWYSLAYAAFFFAVAFIEFRVRRVKM